MGGAVWQKYFHTQNRKCPCLTPILGENMWFAFSIIWNKDENIHICILSVCFQKSFILIPCNKIKEQESMWKILLLPSDQIVHPKISLTPSVMLLQFLEIVDSFWMCFSITFLLSLHQWPVIQVSHATWSQVNFNCVVLLRILQVRPAWGLILFCLHHSR